MILGQSAATAAALAIDGSLPVQKVPYAEIVATISSRSALPTRRTRSDEAA